MQTGWLRWRLTNLHWASCGTYCVGMHGCRMVCRYEDFMSLLTRRVEDVNPPAGLINLGNRFSFDSLPALSQPQVCLHACAGLAACFACALRSSAVMCQDAVPRSCFANAALQCLFATPPVAQHLAQRGHSAAGCPAPEGAFCPACELEALHAQARPCQQP